MSTYTCKCGRAAEGPRGGSIGNIERITGMKMYMTNMCDFVPVCAACREKTMKAFDKMHSLLGQPRYMAYVSLLKDWERWKEANGGQEVGRELPQEATDQEAV